MRRIISYTPVPFLPAILTQIEYAADVIIDTNELTYLTEFSVGKIITASMLQTALQRLRLKIKFHSCILSFRQHWQGVKLRCSFKSLWTIGKIVITNSSAERQRYAALYSMHAGDVFNAVEHRKSLWAIKKQLEQEGFFNATIECRFKYNHAIKSIIPTLAIAKGPQFTFQGLQVVF